MPTIHLTDPTAPTIVRITATGEEMGYLDPENIYEHDKYVGMRVPMTVNRILFVALRDEAKVVADAVTAQTVLIGRLAAGEEVFPYAKGERGVRAAGEMLAMFQETLADIEALIDLFAEQDKIALIFD